MKRRLNGDDCLRFLRTGKHSTAAPRPVCINEPVPSASGLGLASALDVLAGIYRDACCQRAAESLIGTYDKRWDEIIGTVGVTFALYFGANLDELPADTLESITVQWNVSDLASSAMADADKCTRALHCAQRLHEVVTESVRRFFQLGTVSIA